jgi:hypothetical protein
MLKQLRKDRKQVFEISKTKFSIKIKSSRSVLVNVPGAFLS